MKTFKIIEGDIAFDSDKKIIMTTNDGEVAQALERCFTTNAGEWFLNALHGLEYPEIQGKGITDEAIQIAVIKAAAQDNRVKEVTGIDIERDEARRTVGIRFYCLLASGASKTVSFNI